MVVEDDFTEYHKEFLEGHYDCVDRIVLNGYFPLGQQGGGFRYWWRKLTGSDETVVKSISWTGSSAKARSQRAFASSRPVVLFFFMRTSITSLRRRIRLHSHRSCEELLKLADEPGGGHAPRVHFLHFGLDHAPDIRIVPNASFQPCVPK